MTVFAHELVISTPGRGFTDVTAELQRVVGASEVRTGIANVFIQHTSASLVVQENADPDVRRDLERFLSELVPDGDRRFSHVDEGPDDMPSHVRAVLTSTSVSLPVREGRLSLGTWQAVYLWEHRRAPHTRRLAITIFG